VPFECTSVYPLVESETTKLTTHFQAPPGFPEHLHGSAASCKEWPPAPPPFRETWYEWRGRHGRERYGVLVCIEEEFRGGYRWILSATPFVDTADGLLDCCGFAALLFIDPLGGVMGAPVYSWNGKVKTLCTAENLVNNEWDWELASHIGTAMFFQGLLSCKNVMTEEVVPPEALSRKRLRKHGSLPYVRYHTLKIRVPGTKTYVDMEAVRRATQDPVPLGLHLVRGHFKTYTAEHGLFGRIAGTFYWPPALRGSLAAGAVGKHYEEQPQKDANG